MRYCAFATREASRELEEAVPGQVLAGARALVTLAWPAGSWRLDGPRIHRAVVRVWSSADGV